LTALGQELAAQSDNGAVPFVRVLVEGKQRELNPMLRDAIYRCSPRPSFSSTRGGASVSDIPGSNA